MRSKLRFNGKIEYLVTADGMAVTGSSSVLAGGWDATLRTWTIYNSEALTSEILGGYDQVSMFLRGSDDGYGTVTLEGVANIQAGGPIDIAYSATTADAFNGHLSAVFDVRIYDVGINAAHDEEYARFDVYVDQITISMTGQSDAVYDNGGAGWVIESTGRAPCYMPLFGIGPFFKPTLSPQVHAGSLVATNSSSVTVAGALAGNMRWKQSGGSWQGAPITIATPTIPAEDGDCGDGLTVTGIIGGTDTWNASLDCSQTVIYDVLIAKTSGGDSTASRWVRTRGETAIGWYCLLADFDQVIKRECLDDHGAVWVRGGYPGVKQAGWRYCADTDSVDVELGIVGATETWTNLHQSYSKFKQETHGRDPETIDDPFGEHTYLVYQVARDNGKSGYIREDTIGGTSTVDPPAYAPHAESVAYQSVVDVQARNNATTRWTANTDILPWMTWGENNALHPVQYLATQYVGGWWGLAGIQNLVRYQSLIAHKPWSIAYYGEDWEVDSSPADWRLYWLTLGSQWNELGTQTREDLISANGVEGGTIGWLESVAFAQPTSWVGQHSYEYRPINLPASKTLTSASASRWHVDVAGTVFGATWIEIPPTATDIRFDLASWTVEPYLYPSIFQNVVIDWDTTTISDVTVYLVGSDGTEVELLTTAHRGVQRGWSNITEPLTSTKYHGTYAQDYGVGEVGDQGSDNAVPPGESATWLADVIRQVVPQLLPTRTAKQLRFEITPNGSPSSLKLAYPVFKAPTTEPVVIHLGRQNQAIVWPNGPMALFGGLNHWDYDLDVQLNPPTTREPGNKATVVDAIAWARALEGSDPSVTSEVAALYDDVDAPPGDARGKTAAAAYFTVSWPTIHESKATLCLQNTWSTPPLQSCPYPRASEDLQRMKPREWAQETRFGLSPAPVTTLKDGSTVWTSTGSGPTGWALVKLNTTPLDNTENNFDLYQGPDHIGKQIRPWHGWYACFGQAAPMSPSGGVFNIHDAWGNYYRAEATGAGVVLKRSNYDVPPFSSVANVTADPSDYSPAVSFDVCGRCHVTWTRPGVGLMRALSSDDGETFEPTETLMAGGIGTNCHTHQGHFVSASFEHDSGDSGPGKIRLVIQGDGEMSMRSPVYVQDGSLASIRFEGFGFHITASPHHTSRLVLTATKEGDSVPSEWVCSDYDDDVTWEEV